MPDFLKRMGAPIAFAALVLLATITMVSDRRALEEGGGRDLPWWQGLALEIAIPVQDAIDVPVSAVRDVFRGYIDLVGVRRENEGLRARVSQLEEESLQYREALVSSGHLERIAAMRDHFQIPMLPAEVVGIDVSPFFRSLLIDRGSMHGVRAGHPVITDAGVAGLVTRTSPHAAKAMLLLDRQSAVDGVAQRSRVRGVVRGRGDARLAFEFVMREGDVVPGDIVITSGLGGVYPKGLRIGRVVSLADPGGGLMQTATLEPAVDYGRLEQVFVMLRRGRTMDLLYGADSPSGDLDASASSRAAAPPTPSRVNGPGVPAS